MKFKKTDAPQPIEEEGLPEIANEPKLKNIGVMIGLGLVLAIILWQFIFAHAMRHDAEEARERHSLTGEAGNESCRRVIVEIITYRKVINNYLRRTFAAVGVALGEYFSGSRWPKNIMSVATH